MAFLSSHSEFHCIFFVRVINEFGALKVFQTILRKTVVGVRESVLIVNDLVSLFERLFATSSVYYGRVLQIALECSGTLMPGF